MPKKGTPKKETPKKETPKKENPKTEAQNKEMNKSKTEKKESPKKEVEPQNKGVDVEKKDCSGNTPLHLAAQAGHLQSARNLLIYTVAMNVNVKNGNGETPLHLAAEGGHMDVVILLLDSGADPSIQDNNGATPCHLAASQGHVEIMEIMTKREENEEKKDEDMSTLEISASKNINPRKKRKLFETGNDEIGVCSKAIESRASNSSYDSGMQVAETEVPLMSEIPERTLENLVVMEAIREINKGGVNENARYMEGYSALQIAARYGMEGAAINFIEKNADVESRTTNGIPTMMVAVGGGSVKILKMMEEAGAVLCDDEVSGVSPIHVAAFHRHFSVLEYLHSRGLDINARSKMGETALHLAARFGDVQLANTLLRLGASKEILNKFGISPMMMAGLRGDEKMEALLYYEQE